MGILYELDSSNKEPKIIKFLKRSKIIENVKDESTNILNLENISFEDFKNILIKINGIIRDIDKEKRGFRKNQFIGGNSSGIVYYLPPIRKDFYFKKVFDKINEIQKSKDILNKNKEIGTVLYYSIQNIHPFEDGNGRTGRFIFNLLKNDFSLDDLGKNNLLLDNKIGRKEGEKDLPRPEMIRLIYSKDFFIKNGIKTEKGIFPIFNGIDLFINDGNIGNIDNYNKVNRIINGNLSNGTFSFKNYIAYKINEYKNIFKVGYSNDGKMLKLDGDIDSIFDNLDDSDLDFILKEYDNFEEGMMKTFLDFNIEDYKNNKNNKKQKEWDKLYFILTDGLEKYFDEEFILNFLDIMNINILLNKVVPHEINIDNIKIIYKKLFKIYQYRKSIIDEFLLNIEIILESGILDIQELSKELNLPIEYLNGEKNILRYKTIEETIDINEKMDYLVYPEEDIFMTKT